MSTQFQCNECGTITEAIAGRCPICDAVVPVDPATGIATPGAPPPAAQPPAAPAPPPQPEPTPRPDPYSQFGNPLHDTWGTPQPIQQPAEPEPKRAHTARKKRPWVSRTIVVVTLLALLGGAWLGRSWLDEQWDSLYETIEGWSGDDEAVPTDPPTSPGLEDVGLSGVEQIEYEDTEENRQFLEWESEHETELLALEEDLAVSLGFEPDDAESVTEAADALGAVSTQVRDVLQLVDTAPDSQLRTAAVTVHMQMLHACDLLEQAFREGSVALHRVSEGAVQQLNITVAKYTGLADKSIVFRTMESW